MEEKRRWSSKRKGGEDGGSGSGVGGNVLG